MLPSKPICLRTSSKSRLNEILYERLQDPKLHDNIAKLKGTQMQIWKSPYRLVFLEKWYSENFAFLILGILELYTRKICEMFVYKHTETTEYIKN